MVTFRLTRVDVVHGVGVEDEPGRAVEVVVVRRGTKRRQPVGAGDPDDHEEHLGGPLPEVD
ncbi:hypothetical protein [Haloarchaeobius sp. DT45]|uniref:hypothetical protein n=1 Tax=Haloarchaeobius sp. DT45 TaxID=3446116 RepID=UPI003F6D4F1E